MMRETVAGVTAAFGAKFDMEYEEGAAVTYNDPDLVSETLPTMKRVLGDANVTSPPPQMGAEDFAYFQKVVPGFYYFLGVGNKAKRITAMIHTPEFDVDEDSLVIGVRVMSSVLLDYLDRQAKAR
jgi:amidohydrolase